MFVTSVKRGMRKFHVVVMQRTAKKGTKKGDESGKTTTATRSSKKQKLYSDISRKDSKRRFLSQQSLVVNVVGHVKQTCYWDMLRGDVVGTCSRAMLSWQDRRTCCEDMLHEHNVGTH